MPKENPWKIQVDKLDFIKIKDACFEKDTFKEIERQAKNWEKIFANPCLMKGLHLKYAMNCLNATIKKKQIQTKNSNRYFIKEDIQMSNIHMKRCWTS